MTDSTPSRGKIGACPPNIREQVNHRLLDGQVDSEILPWLNGLEVVKKRMRERFNGEPISPQNLSAWRTGQFQIWKEERREIEATKELAKFSADLAASAGGHMSAGARALATGRVMAKLQQMGESTDLEDLINATLAVHRLNKGDIESAKLGLQREQLLQDERQLVLAEDKFRLQVGKLILDHIADAEVQRIAASKESQEVKMDQLVLHIWGRRPDQPAAPGTDQRPP